MATKNTTSLKLTVAVGLSGGVDSAMSAKLLKDQGFEVVGVHLYCWPPQSEISKDNLTRSEWIKKHGCRADEDHSAALKTALELGIKFQTLDLSEAYKEKVIDSFYTDYEAGRTPNPDILCNSEIKFGLFLEWAIKEGFDYIATGHYAKKSEQKGEFLLQIPKDEHKDQTYFLYRLTQDQLKRVLFPLGDLTKPQVRTLAQEAKLSVATRPDSQGICFVGNVDVNEFLRRRLKDNPGDVVDIAGQKVGTHKGIWFYTVGERGGWQLTPDAQRSFMLEGETPKLYVIGKDVARNRLIVGPDEDAHRGKFVISNATLISGEPASSILLKKNLYVRIRHGGKLLQTKIVQDNLGLGVILEEPQRGVASGQSAVLYQKTPDGQVICLGGGVIE